MVNPRPLPPEWFKNLMRDSHLLPYVDEGFVERVWEGLMERGNHTQDPYFLNWELHLYSYSGDEYKPDSPDGRK